MNTTTTLNTAGRRGRPLDDFGGRLRYVVRAALRRHAREQAAARAAAEAAAAAETPAAAIEAPPPHPAVRSLVLEVVMLATAIAGAVLLLLLTLVALALDFLGVIRDPVGLAAVAAVALALGLAAGCWLRWLARRVEEASGAR